MNDLICRIYIREMLMIHYAAQNIIVSRLVSALCFVVAKFC